MLNHAIREPVTDASYDYEPGRSLAPQPPVRHQPDLFDRVVATTGRAAAIPMVLGMIFVFAHAVLPSALDPFTWAGDAIGAMEAATEARRIPVAGQMVYVQENEKLRAQSYYESQAGDRGAAIIGSIFCYLGAAEGCGVARNAQSNIMNGYRPTPASAPNPYSRGY